MRRLLGAEEGLGRGKMNLRDKRQLKVREIKRGKKVLHSRGGRSPLSTKTNITRQSARSRVLPIPKVSINKKRSKNKRSEKGKQIKLLKKRVTLPVKYLGKTLELGITRGVT